METQKPKFLVYRLNLYASIYPKSFCEKKVLKFRVEIEVIYGFVKYFYTATAKTQIFKFYFYSFFKSYKLITKSISCQ